MIEISSKIHIMKIISDDLYVHFNIYNVVTLLFQFWKYQMVSWCEYEDADWVKVNKILFIECK